MSFYSLPLNSTIFVNTHGNYSVPYAAAKHNLMAPTKAIHFTRLDSEIANKSEASTDPTRH